MKTRTLYIISFLLLFSSCKVEQQVEYFGFTGDKKCCTVKVFMPDNWKIVNAQLESNHLNLAFDKGRGIEKQSFPDSFSNIDADDSIQFRGANRVGRLALLHFTKEEDPQSAFNPPVAQSGTTEGLGTFEKYAIFRTSNWLMVHFSIESTQRDNLPFLNLKQHYYGDVDLNRSPYCKLTKEALLIVFGKDNREKRSFPIHDFIEQHEVVEYGGGGAGVGEIRIELTQHFKIVPIQKKEQ